MEAHVFLMVAQNAWGPALASSRNLLGAEKTVKVYAKKTFFLGMKPASACGNLAQWPVKLPSGRK